MKKERGREGMADEVARFACPHAHISIIRNAFWETRGGRESHK